MFLQKSQYKNLLISEVKFSLCCVELLALILGREEKWPLLHGLCGSTSSTRMGRGSQGHFPYSSPQTYSISVDSGVIRSRHLCVLSLLPLPTSFIQTCVNFLLQVYAQLDVDNASRSSCSVLFSITASCLGRFYISKCDEKHIFHIYFSSANRAPFPGPAGSQDT